ncbi:MAG: hypothetical protein ABSA30_09925, partial [Candidatus Aminicenantales bacterium]
GQRRHIAHIWQEYVWHPVAVLPSAPAVAEPRLLRQGEAEEVVGLFRGHYNIPLVHVEAGHLFLGALTGIRDPEEKRKIIENITEKIVIGNEDVSIHLTYLPSSFELMTKGQHNVRDSWMRPA